MARARRKKIRPTIEATRLYRMDDAANIITPQIKNI
jgi:hypothetical protein